MGRRRPDLDLMPNNPNLGYTQLFHMGFSHDESLSLVASLDAGQSSDTARFFLNHRLRIDLGCRLVANPFLLFYHFLAV